MADTTVPMSLRERFDGARADIQALGNNVHSLMEIIEQNAPSEGSGKEDFGEMKANVMLAYRHLEDARMRIGKVIQAYEGGESIYDKKGQ